jgi:hypothetical protein
MTKQERKLNGSVKASERKNRIDTLGGFGMKITKSVKNAKNYDRKSKSGGKWSCAWGDE